MEKVREILRNAVTLDQLKGWLRLNGDNFDESLRMCLASAMAEAETYTGLTLSQSRYVVSLPFIHRIDPSVHRITEVESVKVDGTAIALTNVTLDRDVVTISDNVSGSSVEVTFLAGDETIAPDIASAIMMIAAARFNSPVDSVENLPKASTNLLRPHKYFNV